MARAPRVYFPGAVFHVMARGNFRQNIFQEPKDWERFLDILVWLKRSRPFKLHAYCLMSNHIHLLIESIDVPISRIMATLLTRYATYLNGRMGRVGHVFQGRFKAPLCRKDAYLQHLVRYIHLNPVAAGIVSEPGAWPYSGHLEYIGDSARRIVDSELVLSMFDDDLILARTAYARFVVEGMAQSAETILPVISDKVPPAIPRSSPTWAESPPRPVPMSDLAMACARGAGVDQGLLSSATRIRSVVRARHEFIQRAFQAGYSVSEIAEYLGLSASAISKVITNVR